MRPRSNIGIDVGFGFGARMGHRTQIGWVDALGVSPSRSKAIGPPTAAAGPHMAKAESPVYLSANNERTTTAA